MDVLNEFPLEFSQPFEYSFRLLRRTNYEFFKDSTCRTFFNLFILMPLLVIHNVSISIHMFREIGSGTTIAELAFEAPLYLMGIQSVLKAIVTIPKKRDIERLIRNLAEMWRQDDLTATQLEKKNRLLKQNRYGQVVFFLIAEAAIILNLYPQFLYTILQRVILKNDFDFIILIRGVLPFDPLMNWTRYSLTYVYQLLCSLVMAYFYLGNALLLTVLCSHLCIEFTLLREDLKYITPKQNNDPKYSELSNEDGENRNMTIEKFVYNHQKLIKLAHLLNYAFNRMVFTDLCFFAIINCFYTFGLTIATNATEIFSNLVPVGCLLMMVYILCYNGVMLQEETMGIADSAYESLWYNSGTYYQRSIRLIILRAQVPCCLTSLNYAPISLNTFVKVISTTWSYLSLLKTMSD